MKEQQDFGNMQGPIEANNGEIIALLECENCGMASCSKDRHHDGVFFQVNFPHTQKWSLQQNWQQSLQQYQQILALRLVSLLNMLFNVFLHLLVAMMLLLGLVEFIKLMQELLVGDTENCLMVTIGFVHNHFNCRGFLISDNMRENRLILEMLDEFTESEVSQPIENWLDIVIHRLMEAMHEIIQTEARKAPFQHFAHIHLISHKLSQLNSKIGQIFITNYQLIYVCRVQYI
uniref:Uncharacterized protein n=1 Tax=Lutzomyia longipalpis TaxID=7200 RepID=A0A1B0C9K0_LUTLO